MKKLKKLNLGCNQIPNLTLKFSELKNLEELGLIRQEKINAKELFNNLSKCKNLKRLHLSVNNIETLPSEISLLNSLEEINLYQNKIKELPNEIIENRIDTNKIKKVEMKMPKVKFIY